MNTNIQYEGEFKELFGFENEDERIDFVSDLISFQILAEIRKYLETHSQSKKFIKAELADILGKSRPYVTQLYSGDKFISRKLLATFLVKTGTELSLKIEPARIQNVNTADDYSREIDFMDHLFHEPQLYASEPITGSNILEIMNRGNIRSTSPRQIEYSYLPS